MSCRAYDCRYAFALAGETRVWGLVNHKEMSFQICHYPDQLCNLPQRTRKDCRLKQLVM